MQIKCNDFKLLLLTAKGQSSVTHSTQDQTKTKAMPMAGESAILARRYALALYDLAVEQNALDAVVEQLTAVQHALAQVPELNRLINDPRVTREQMTSGFKIVTQHGQLGLVVANFLSLLAKNRRAALLPQILVAFATERARRAGEILAIVRVARPLSATQQQQIISHLAQATGGTVRLQVQEDASLIGGMVINFGSMQIDASLRGRLASLTQQLREAA
jgi:F-type H+-transporting ATPase subunit delta